MTGRPNETPLYVQSQALVQAVMQRMERIPRHQRFILGARTQTAAMDLLDAVTLALLHREHRVERIDAADAAALRLTNCLRMTRDLELVPERWARQRLVELADIGRQLGGWRKHASRLFHAGEHA